MNKTHLWLPILVLALPLWSAFGLANAKSQPLTLQTQNGSALSFEGGIGSPVHFTLPHLGNKEVVMSHVEPHDFFDFLKQKPEPSRIGSTIPDPLVSRLATPFEGGIAYAQPGARTADYYLNQADRSELKHYRVYSRGSGQEAETYEFKNAVLHINGDGDIEGWYVEKPDFSQNADAKGAPGNLLDRAQWTLFHDRLWDLHLHGGENPDFIVPRPIAFGSDGESIPVFAKIDGDWLNRLTLSFSPSSYPVALDPSVLYAASADYRITGNEVGYNSYFGASIAIGDLNSDGKSDLAISSYEGTYLFYQDSTLWGTSSCTTNCLAASADRYINGNNNPKIVIADVNNDGKNDLVTVSNYATVFIQDGSWGTVPCTTNCSYTNADYFIYSQSSSGFVGVTVADLNNDGRSDLAIGSPNYSSNTGRTYIFLQDSTLWGTTACTSSCQASNADYILQGQASSAFGSSLAVGDLNNDGRNDLAVGANGTSTSTGRAYIFLQDSTYSGWGTAACAGTDGSPCSAASADYILQGQATYNYFGDSIAIGDLNNDGRLDLAATAYGTSTSTGRAYVFLQDASYSGWGASACAGTDGSPCLAINADYILQGQATYNYFGRSLAVGDLNSDGLSDLALGAIDYSSSTGRAYVFLQDAAYSGWGAVACVGSDASPCLAVNADYIIQGEPSIFSTGYDFGRSLAIGDLNNDGKKDLAVSAVTPGSAGLGRFYLFLQDASYSGWGSVSCTGNDASPCLATNADYAISGLPDNNFGYSLAVGDMNYDGKDDLVVGGPYDTLLRGSVYVFLQDSTLWGTSTCTANCSATSADYIIRGQPSGSGYFGNAVAVGDLNNDGRSDLVVGAYQRTPNSRAYIFLQDNPTYSGWGTAACTTSCSATNADYIIDSQSSINFPTSLAVGDLNNDGRKDLIVNNSNYSSNTGRVYIFLQDATYSGWGTAACAGTDGSPCSATNADYILQGQASSFFGASFAVGDLNNDGRVDLAVSGSSYNGSVGRAYIFLQDATYSGWGTAACAGTDGSPCLAVNADYILQGQTSSTFGNPVAVGDFNSDGKADLAVGAIGYSTNTGRAYVFLQDASYSGWGASACAGTDGSPCLAVNADYILQGGATYNYFGYPLVAGDLNNDGRVDLAVGTYSFSNLDRAYVFLQDATYSGWGIAACAGTDGSPCSATNADTILNGESIPNTVSYFGYAIAMGQMDNLGGKDLVVGATAFNRNQGRVYLFNSLWNNPSYQATGSVQNAAPSIPSSISDGGSSSTTPTNVGLNVSFTATTTDGNSDQWYLAICKTNSVTAGNDSAPTCPGGNWGIGGPYNSASGPGYDSNPAIIYTALEGDASSNVWYAFACDKRASDAACSTSSQGSGDTGSPFAVNHRPTYSGYSATDATSGTIEPGDIVKFTVTTADTDSDTVALYVCASGNTFNGSACSGTELCHTAQVVAGSVSCTTSTSPVPVPTAHGPIGVEVFVVDPHGFTGSLASAQNFTVQDVAPILISYTGSDPSSTPSAGGSDTFNFVANLQDNNGENDITAANGLFFEDTAVNNDCTANEQNCYIISSCSLNTAYGNSAQVQAQCSATVWFNASYSTNWEVHIYPTDGLGTHTSLADSDINVTINPIGGISTVQSSVNYGSLNLGALSSQQSVTVQNAGNVTTDVGLAGTPMTYSTDTIPRANQHWSGSNGFAYNAGYALVETATQTSASSGCFNANLAAATDHTSLPNVPVYWLLLTPENIKSGTYTGSNSVSLITCQ